MVKVFIGYDDRQPLSANVLQHSIVARANKQPVAITQLRIQNLPITRTGLTSFTFSRYLVPYLCDYQGWGLFLDSDMLCLGDISELFDCADPEKAVMVVQNKMRFEWPSLMLFNCEKCQALTPNYVQNNGSPQDFSWANGQVGMLPAEWNHCANYDAPRSDAKLVHYTQGVPIWFETRDSEYGQAWMDELKDMERICSWSQIMAASVHAKPVLERMLKGYAEAQIAQMKEMQKDKAA